jgi:hypothetical protein
MKDSLLFGGTEKMGHEQETQALSLDNGHEKLIGLQQDVYHLQRRVEALQGRALGGRRLSLENDFALLRSDMVSIRARLQDSADRYYSKDTLGIWKHQTNKLYNRLEDAQKLIEKLASAFDVSPGTSPSNQDESGFILTNDHWQLNVVQPTHATPEKPLPTNYVREEVGCVCEFILQTFSSRVSIISAEKPMRTSSVVNILLSHSKPIQNHDV